MGGTVALTVAFEVPIFQIAPKLLHRFGSDILLLVAAAAYVTRVVGYTFIPANHVQWVLLLEPLHGVTYACTQTAIVDFVARRTPVGYEASGQGFVYTMRGIGAVLGLYFGGWAQDKFGPRAMFRASAGVVLIGATVFAASVGVSYLTSSTGMGTVELDRPNERQSTSNSNNPQHVHMALSQDETDLEDGNDKMGGEGQVELTGLGRKR